MENIRNHVDIKLATTNEKRNELVSQPNYYNKTFFRIIISNRNEKDKSNNE